MAGEGGEGWRKAAEVLCVVGWTWMRNVQESAIDCDLVVSARMLFKVLLLSQFAVLLAVNGTEEK